MIKGFDNVSIPVAEMERALAFYRDVLGLTVKETYGDTMSFMAVPNANTTIMLREQAESQPSQGYLCLVAEDVRAAHPNLVAKGVTVTDGPYHIPEVGYGMDFSDPDGNRIVLIDYTEIEQG